MSVRCGSMILVRVAICGSGGDRSIVAAFACAVKRLVGYAGSAEATDAR
jgi:hypothetical protein